MCVQIWYWTSLRCGRIIHQAVETISKLNLTPLEISGNLSHSHRDRHTQFQHYQTLVSGPGGPADTVASQMLLHGNNQNVTRLTVIFQEAGGEFIFFRVREPGRLFTPPSSLEAILIQPACCPLWLRSAVLILSSVSRRQGVRTSALSDEVSDNKCQANI